MIKNFLGKSVATKVSAITLAIILISTAAVGIFSYVIYKNVAVRSHAERALAISDSVAASIDAEKYAHIMSTMETDEYWETLQAQINQVKAHTAVDYLYIVDRNYDSTIVTFIDAYETLADEPLGLGGEEDVDAYADEMYEALDTGKSQMTGLYYAEGYGMMVGGYTPVLDAQGRAVAVVGVDVGADEVVSDADAFGMKIVLIVLLVTLATVWIPIVFVRRKVGEPLRELCAVSDLLAVGDLRVNPPEVRSGDEVGELAQSFKAMVESTREQVKALKQLAGGDLSVSHYPRCEHDGMTLSMIHLTEQLNEMMGEIHTAATHVSQGAKQIADNSQHMAQSTAEQTTSVELLTEATYRLYDKTGDNTTKTGEAAGLTRQIEEAAQTGSEQMKRMIVAVNEINEANKSISNVMKVIDDIAFQTNILALNAAVEAARAGERGKGFAVVADEVRSLAGKSAEAARETATLISNSVEKARLGATIANETSDSLTRIVSGIQDSTKLVAQIAEASSGQSADISELKKGIEQMSGTVHQNSSAAQESAATCEEMNSQSEVLNGLVSRFKLK